MRNSYSADLVKARFGYLKKQTMKASIYAEDLDCFYYSGQAEALEALINMHAKESFKTADEVIGEAQILLVKAFNSVSAIKKNERKLSVEEILK